MASENPMNQLPRLLISALAIAGCIVAILLQSAQATLMQPTSTLLPPEPKVAQLNRDREIDFGQHFQDLDVEGSILIHDLNNDRIYQHNPNRNATAFLPASTFKIPNSLIALETGAIPNEIAVLTWDGIRRSLPGWNRDLNMREAFKLSAVWFYQVLARRVGYERMQQWVARIGYGNQNIGSEDEIDRFWLEGELRITPQEQIQFLRRLYQNDLPFSETSLSTVKDIMIVEQTPDYTMRAKTGWSGFGEPEKPQIGWYVGYLEQDENVYFFATNIDIRNDNDPRNRIEVTRRCLKSLGLL